MALVVEGANNGSKFRGSVCKSRMPGAGYLSVRCPMGKQWVSTRNPITALSFSRLEECDT